MPEEQRSGHLTEEQVEARTEEIWNKLNVLLPRLAQPWAPEPGSDLARDDGATSETQMWPSALARTSLAIATENYYVAVTWMLNHGPTVFSMFSLLRTALAGGAQTVWMLSPDAHEQRLQRTTMVAKDARWNHYLWAKGIVDPHPAVVDAEALTEVRETLEVLAGDQRQAEVRLTTVIEEATRWIYRNSPDERIVNEALGMWRTMSCVVHALPWELNTRPESGWVEVNNVRTTRTEATWAAHQGALGLCWATIDNGWRMIDLRGSAPETQFDASTR